MPDSDIIRRFIRPAWRKPAQAIRGGSEAETIARMVPSALANTLRQSKGCPGLNVMATEIRAVTQTQDVGRLTLLSEKLERSAIGKPNHRNVILMTEVARSMVETGGAEGLNEDEIALSLSEQVLRRLTRAFLVDPLQSSLIQRFGDFGRSSAFIEKCLNPTQIRNLAARLLRHEDGEGLVAPPARVERLATREILDLPVSQVGHV